MLTRCVFCRKPFPANETLVRLSGGRRLAYDPGRGRLWVVCGHCHRWNLHAVEDRLEALHELERGVRDRGHYLAGTANVSLFDLGDLSVVRVGRAGLAEQAWWRYGRELHRRRRQFHSPASRLTAYAYGALAYVGEALGLGDEDLSITWDDTPVADILRWRRFGWAAWYGRADCPFCGSTLRALRYDLSWWVQPMWKEGGELAVGVPCPRCDPWTPEKVYLLQGTEAENALRRVLAYQHISGASEKTLRDAARAIEEQGDAEAYARAVGGGGTSLWSLGSVRSIALEIALNETVEERLLGLEVRALEAIWRREEEMARIIDEELTPRRILERHLRRLPVDLLAGETQP